MRIFVTAPFSKRDRLRRQPDWDVLRSSSPNQDAALPVQRSTYPREEQ